MKTMMTAGLVTLATLAAASARAQSTNGGRGGADTGGGATDPRIFRHAADQTGDDTRLRRRQDGDDLCLVRIRSGADALCLRRRCEPRA